MKANKYLSRHLLKTLVGIVLLALACLDMRLNAADLETTKGKRYTDVVVTDETTTHVKFRHADGIANMLKSELKPASAKALGLNLPDMTEVAAEYVDQVAQIKSKLTEIRTKDGRVFKTHELQTVDPSGLKFFGDSGVARVKFTELPPEVTEKLGWDRQKVLEHEEEFAKEQAAQDSKRREYEQAQSMVDSLHFEAKIKPILKVNAGWLCAVSERKKFRFRW